MPTGRVSPFSLGLRGISTSHPTFDTTRRNKDATLYYYNAEKAPLECGLLMLAYKAQPVAGFEL